MTSKQMSLVSELVLLRNQMMQIAAEAHERNRDGARIELCDFGIAQERKED
jgi:hypothetical protein